MPERVKKSLILSSWNRVFRMRQVPSWPAIMVVISLVLGALVGGLVFYVDYMLPPDAIQAERIQSLRVYDRVQSTPISNEDQTVCRHVIVEGAMLESTVRKATLAAGGLPPQYPTWIAQAVLDDGSVLPVRLSHLGKFQIMGQRGVYSLPKSRDLMLYLAEEFRSLREMGTTGAVIP